MAFFVARFQATAYGAALVSQNWRPDGCADSRRLRHPDDLSSMRERSSTHSAMHSAKLALLRCENLDLFAAAGSVPAAPAWIEPDPADYPTGEPGLLFRIGPDDQLDLFRHSPAEIAATQTRRALQRMDVVQARKHLAQLRRAPAYASLVADSEQCIELIERRDPRWSDAALAMPWIETELWPAAERCLQRDAMLLLRPALLALLERNEQRPFDAVNRCAHASHIWQLLGQPTQAVAALELDPHWRQQSAALLWHAQLCEEAGLHERILDDIAELCRVDADAAEDWLSASRTWAVRWSAWCDLDDALPMHAFPAWCRLTRATVFPLPDAGDRRAGAQLLRIADLLAALPDDLNLRKALHSQCPALLAAFLSSRVARSG